MTADSGLAKLHRALNRPVVAILAVGAIAATLRFWGLSYPPTRIFDEIYYSKSACIFLGYSNSRCDIDSSEERFWRTDKNDTGAWVHPPLGKWAIGLGELAFGTGSLGWRFSSAVAGTLTVMLLAGMVQLLFGSPVWTFTGGLLLATENLSFVQSRTSMLDVFVTFWIALALLLVLLDRRWMERRAPAPPSAAARQPPIAGGAGVPPGSAEVAPGPPMGAAPTLGSATPSRAARTRSPLWRPWRVAAGVALGAAVATKWSGVTAILAAIVLSYLWEGARRRRAGVERWAWRTVRSESFPIVLWLIALPFVVYVVSWAGWFAHFGFHIADWMRLQGAMVDYHAHLEAVNDQGKPIHPYLSQGWKWLLLWRPVLYFARYFDDGRRVIYTNGNPAIFWGSLVAIPYAAFAWWRRRDWRAGYVVVTVACLYVPWLFVTRPQFLFYVTPIVPFLVLADTYALRDLSEAHVAGSRSRPYLPVAVGLVVISVGLFIFFWPVLTGGHLSTDAFTLRSWFPTWP